MARDITIKYVGDSTSAERAAARVKAANEKVSSGFSSMASSASTNMRRVGSSLTSAGRSITAFATLPIAGGFALAIKAASDFNEQASKMEVVFGTQATAIRIFASTAAESLGLSTKAVFEATSTFGNLFQQLGIAPQLTAQWSTSLTQAAADLGSFHNADITEVIEAQTAAFRGEYDALQRFIPTINAATVQQKAMEQTGKDNAAQLTAGEKAAATYTIMMENLGAAQGDFARTSDSAANRQRILEARFENLATTIGQQVLPIAVQFGEILASVLDRFNSLSPQVQKFILIGLGLIAVLGPIVGAVGALATVVGLLISPVGLVIAAVALLVVGIIYAYQHFEGFRDVVANVVEWVQTTAIPVMQEFADIVIAKFQELAAWVREIWPQIQEAITHTMNVISDVVQAVLSIIQKAWRLFGDDILAFVQSTWEAIQLLISGVMQVIRGVISLVLALINGEWGEAWNAIKDIFEGVWMVILSVVQRFLALIQLGIGIAYATIQNMTAVAWDWIWAKIVGVWEGIKSGVSAAVAWVRDVLAGVWATIAFKASSVWNGILGALRTIWTSIKSAVATGVNGVIGIINGLIGGVNAVIRILPGDLPQLGTIGTVGSGNISFGDEHRSPRRAMGGTVPPFITDGARAIVGEGKPAFPEYVIPTDPKYRSRSLGLVAELADKLMASGGRVPAMAAGGRIPAFGIGGIPNPISAVGGVVSDALDFARKGAAMALFAGPNRIAEAALNLIPWDLARGIGQHVRQTLYDWVKGEDDKLPSEASGPGPRGRGIAGLIEPLASKVAAVIAQGGGAVSVVSGWRSSAQQALLYQRYIAGTGNLAARPGSSKHERGLAVDFGGDRALYTQLARMQGLHAPVRGEPWHWEVPGYKNGTDFVPRDGLAWLHRGEAVTPASASREIVVHTHLEVDGREIAEIVDRHQIANNGRSSVRSR